MKILLAFSLIIILLQLFYSCDTTEPPINKTTISLKLEDVSCTEAWVQFSGIALQLPNTLTLYINNQPKETINLTTADTLLYIDSLLPNQTYKIIAAMEQSNNASNELSITTMDTTSHNFTSWQKFFFGDIGSSDLFDVEIIDENNIWAVGEIQIRDTSINGYTTYNAAHWDGNEWELLRIPNYDYPNTLVYGALQAVFAFSENDIWFCSYSNLVHFDGNSFSSKAQFMTSINFNGQIKKIWGTDKYNIFCAGRNGAIYHFFGTGWQKIESGTALNINDIWGSYNEKTKDWEILAVASNFGSTPEKEILKIKDNTVTKLPLSDQMWSFMIVWFIPDRQYYVGGAGIYQKKFLSDSQWKDNALDITTFATYSIRGNDVNDVVGVGAYGDLVHYNGMNWKSDYVEPYLNYGSYWAVKIKGDLIVAVGSEYSQAAILMGKR